MGNLGLHSDRPLGHGLHLQIFLFFPCLPLRSALAWGRDRFVNPVWHLLVLIPGGADRKCGLDCLGPHPRDVFGQTLNIAVAVVPLQPHYDRSPLAGVHSMGDTTVTQQGGMALQAALAIVATQQRLPGLLRLLNIGGRA